MSSFTRPALCVLAALISLKFPGHSARWKMLINLPTENSTYNRPWLPRAESDWSQALLSRKSG